MADKQQSPVPCECCGRESDIKVTASGAEGVLSFDLCLNCTEHRPGQCAQSGSTFHKVARVIVRVLLIALAGLVLANCIFEEQNVGFWPMAGAVAVIVVTCEMCAFVSRGDK